MMPAAPLSLRIDELGEDDLLITPNLRSARMWSQAAAQAHRGTVRAAPTILPTQHWLALAWRAMRSAAAARNERLPALLSAAQEQVLWQRVLANSDISTLMSPSGMVRPLMQAWRLAHTWSCPNALLDVEDSPEAVAYRTLQRAFRDEAKRLHVITAAQLPGELTRWIEQGGALPAPLRYARIVTLPTVQDDPALHTLIEALVRRGAQPARLVWREQPVPAHVAWFESPAAEWRAAALWARERVAQHPGTRVVIVVPRLHEVRHAVRRVMRDVMAPEHWGDPFTESGDRFNLSLGVRLTDVPYVASALAWLHWAVGPMPLADVRVALSGRFLPDTGCAQPWIAEAIERGQSRVSLAAVSAWGVCAAPISAFEKATAAWPRRALPSDWARHFVAALHALGFSEGEVDSVTAQAIVALYERIEALGTLDAVLGECDARQAWATLASQCAEHDFQGEGQEAPVQVLGLYESLGFACDGLWVTGLSDEVLPEPSELSPWLPAAWQRSAKVGRATPELAAEAARRIWAQWSVAAPEFYVSASGYAGETPRPFAFCVPTAQTNHVAWGVAQADSDAAATASVALEAIPDARGLAVDPSQRRLPGGTRTLQQQAECPFQAYAAQRLRVDPFPRHTYGLDRRTLGNAVHQALRSLWDTLGEQETWLALDESQRREYVRTAVEAAFRDIERECAQRGLPPVLMPVLREQLCALIGQWMETVEERRAPFSVAHREHAVRLPLGPIELNVRLDRVDTLADGSTLVMDYKTGNTGSLSALTEAARAALTPQLPAYALALRASEAAPPQGVAYGKVLDGQCSLRGAGMNVGAWFDGGAPRKSTVVLNAAAWSNLLDAWEAALVDVAARFMNGEAGVLPANADVCRSCQRQALCRVNVAQEEDAEIGEADDAAGAEDTHA